jgi:hypothetical protein
VGIWADGAFYEEGCLTYIPNYISDAPEASPGGTISGEACAELPTKVADASRTLIYVMDEMAEEGTRYFIEFE